MVRPPPRSYAVAAVAVFAGLGCTPDPAEPPPLARPDAPQPATHAPTVFVDPPGGVWDGPVTVQLGATDPRADIWYTLDGTAPVVGASERYTGPFVLRNGALVRATAVNDLGAGSVAAAHLQLYDDLDGFSSNLPVIVVWSDSAPLPADKTDDYAPFTLTVFDPGVGGRVAWPSASTLSVRAGIRIHGSSTADDPKHAWRVETWAADADADLDVQLLGMPAEADWLLGAPLRFDRALMRNTLVYALSDAIGQYAPRTRFAEVFVAEQGEKISLGDYAGVYEVTEVIARGDDRVDIPRLDPDDLDEPEISGGYLFKEDRAAEGEHGFAAGTAGGAFAFDHPFVYVDPDEAEIADPQAAWLADRLDRVGAALAGPGLVDPVTGARADAMLDLDAWIDHHVIELLTRNPDAFRLSGYYHQDRGDDGGVLAAGPVWDFDRTLGCAEDERCDAATGWDAVGETDEDATPMFDYGWWRGLFADPGFRAAYWDRWRALSAGELAADAVVDRIEANRALLREAAARNFDAWPDYPPRGGDFDAEVDLLRGWVEARLAWIDGCLALADPAACPR